MVSDHDAGKRLSPWAKDYASGCIAGAVNVFVGYPFDTVKVTLQNSSPGRFTGPIQCCSHILNHRGVRFSWSRCVSYVFSTIGRCVLIHLRPVRLSEPLFALACELHRFKLYIVAGISPRALPATRDDIQVSGLFSGVSSPIVGGAVETGVNYLVYSTVLQHLSGSVSNEVRRSHPHPLTNNTETSPSTPVTPKRPSSRPPGTAVLQDEDLWRPAANQATTPPTEPTAPAPSLRNVAIAAAASGFALSFILSPTELVKCRMQVRGATTSHTKSSSVTT